MSDMVRGILSLSSVDGAWRVGGIAFFLLMAPLFGQMNAVSTHLLTGDAGFSLLDMLLFAFACLIVSALISALVAWLCGSRRILPRLACCILLAIVLMLSLDYSYGLLTDTSAHSRVLRTLVVALSMMLSVSLMMFENIRTLAITMAATFCASSGGLYAIEPRMFRDWDGGGGKPLNVALPPIVHIILDEMIGVDGIDTSRPRAAKARVDMVEFFDRYGFRYFGKTFSRHPSTLLSIPNMMNYDYIDRTYGALSKHVVNATALVDNRYFDDLKLAGYVLNVYQTPHLNFCAYRGVSRCRTLNSFNSRSRYISPSLGEPDRRADSLRSRLSAILNTFLQHSKGPYLSDLAKQQASTSRVFGERWDTQSFVKWFAKFGDDVVRTAGGEATVLHVLMPHYPYLLTAGCQRLPSSARAAKDGLFSLSGREIDSLRSRIEDEYYEQVSCAFLQLNELMSKIDANPAMGKAIILIHGDHGSRIAKGADFDEQETRDYIANFSTLFAIRAPNTTPGYAPRSVSIRRLFSEIFDRHSRGAPGKPEYLAVNKSKPDPTVVDVPMPNF